MTLFFLVLTVGRGVAELWSRLLLFQLFQLANQLSNMSQPRGAAGQDIPLMIRLCLLVMLQASFQFVELRGNGLESKSLPHLLYVTQTRARNTTNPRRLLLSNQNMALTLVLA